MRFRAPSLLPLLLTGALCAQEPPPAPEKAEPQPPVGESPPAAAPSLLPPAPVAPREAFAAMDQAAMQALFKTLRENYVRPGQLSWDALNRAALAGVVEHLKAGAEVVSADQPSAAPPLSHEVLTGRIAWLRPGAFTEAELEMLDRALTELAKTPVELLILDLRCPAAPSDARAAAAILSRFFRDDEPLFALSLPGREPEQFSAKGPVKWMRRLVLLVDEECGSTAEIIASVLQRKLRPLIAGAATRGAAAQFRTAPLTDKLTLRFAEGDVIPDGGEPLFGQPVKPDFPLPSDLAAKRAVITASSRSGIAAHVFEKERPRLNEAALVAGTNPELPQRIAETEKRKTGHDEPPVIDRVLQQTVDLLESAEFLKLDAPVEEKPAEPVPK